MKFILKFVISLTHLYFLQINAEIDNIILTGNGKCITNGSSAISFNYSVNDEIPFDGPYRYPSLGTNDFDCDFEENSACWQLDGWEWKKSFDGKGYLNPLIIDERWEKFKVHKTSYTEEDENTLDYKSVEMLTEDDYFERAFSVKLEHDAHLFLCESSYPPNSRCYWILLGYSKGNSSGIRKCDKGKINATIGYPTEPCSKIHSQRNHSVNKILNENTWIHYKLSWYSGKLEVFKGNEEFLSYIDKKNGRWFNPKYMIIHSKLVHGTWKIHQNGFLFSENEGTQQYGEAFSPKNGKICISMYIGMCKTCQLTVIIKNYEDPIFYKSYYTKDIEWTRIKVEVNGDNDQYYTLHLSKILSDPLSPKRFWAVDEIRICTEKEFRYLIAQKGNVICEKMSATKPLPISIQGNISSKAVDCPEDTFGSSCVPNKLLGYNQFKYCESIGADVTCRCSAGYHGKECKMKCANGFYGHSCTKKCNQCASLPCGNIDGFCKECKEGYTENKCDQPLEPIFENAPTVSPGVNYCEVQVHNFNIVGRWKYLTTFIIQHKIIGRWIDSAHFRLNENMSYNISNLPSDETIDIRLKVENYPEYKGGSLRRTISCTTTCVPLSQNNFVFVPRNTSVSIQLDSDSLKEDNCRSSKYIIKGTNINLLAVVQVPNLKPYSNYTLQLVHPGNHELTIHYHTLQGVPSKVRNVKSKFSNTSLTLSWEEPLDKNGIIEYYEVIYQFIRKRECSDNPTKETTRNVQNESVIINNLQPYSLYVYGIKARTKGGTSDANMYEGTTMEGPFSKEEKIVFKDVPSHDTIRIVFDAIPCENSNGPIYLRAEIICNEKWCQGSTYTRQSELTNSIIFEFTNCAPFSGYSLIVERSRNNNTIFWETVSKKTVNTKAYLPNKIGTPEVTSKNSKSISIRWKAPYPPTGTLEYFRIISTCNEEIQSKLIQKNEHCLWPQYHCGTIFIGNIPLDTLCSLQLYAKNKEIDDINVIADIPYIVAKMDAPSPPEDLGYEFNDDGDMKIYWNHPNNTNGVLKNFSIEISHQNRTIPDGYVIHSEDDYRLTYSRLITESEMKIEMCRSVQIRVRAYNQGEFKSQWETKNLKIPPRITKSLKILRKSSSNTTIEIILETENKRSDDPEQWVYVFVSKKNSVQIRTEDLLERIKHEGNQQAFRCKFVLYNLTNSIVIGNYGNSYCNQNKPLKPGKFYNITIVIQSTCKQSNSTAYKFIWKVMNTLTNDWQEIDNYLADEGNRDGLFSLVILLLIPASVFTYWYLKKKHLIGSSNQNMTGNDDRIVLAEVNQENDSLSPTPKRRKYMELKTVHSQKIKIFELENYVKASIASGELERQHNLFPRGLIYPHNYGSLPQNMPKNRYKNLIAYDHTRVKLKPDGNDQYSDYINANYISGYKASRAYIATQGPKKNTLNDFWRMIWEQNVQHIVMLANIIENGKKKVEKYWPDINDELIFGNIKIKYMSKEIFANFEYTQFSVYCEDHERKLDHLHFTTWPDHGVPMYPESLVLLLQRMLKIPYRSNSPILVHCSAGVGRTGTIILCDICLRMAACEGSVDFLARLENLRKERANLVDNIEQYKLVHLVVLECLFGMRNSIPCNESIPKIIESRLHRRSVEVEMNYISSTMWQDNAMETILDVDTSINYPEKNRFENILPGKYRIYLSLYPKSDPSSSYINAVRVDGFRAPGRYIITQQPMPNTLGDFWRMIVEQGCRLVILLNELITEDQTTCCFWPTKNNQITPVPFIRLRLVEEKESQLYRFLNVLVESEFSQESSFNVTILSFRDWKPKEILPRSIPDFLSFIEEADILSRNMQPIIVTCYDGVTGCGLYIALAFIIEKIKLEHECDVCQAVRTIRHFRQQFVTNAEQYKFLYQGALSFINTYQSYSNFT